MVLLATDVGAIFGVVAGIPPEFYTVRDLVKAAVQGIRHLSSGAADVLGLFSEALRNDSDLVLLALRTLRHLRRSPHELSFVGRTLCDDAVFFVRAAEDLALPPDDTQERQDFRRCTPKGGLRRLLDLSDVSERLRQDVAVLSAFCRLDMVNNLVLAPEVCQSDATVIQAACDTRPAAIWQVPPCPTRSSLFSSLPFIVHLLKESAFLDLDKARFETLPSSLREDREVSFAAAISAHAALVHPRWSESVDFWCEAICQTKVNFAPLLRSNPRNLAVPATVCWKHCCTGSPIANRSGSASGTRRRISGAGEAGNEVFTGLVTSVAGWLAGWLHWIGLFSWIVRGLIPSFQRQELRGHLPDVASGVGRLDVALSTRGQPETRVGPFCRIGGTLTRNSGCCKIRTAAARRGWILLHPARGDIGCDIPNY